MLTLVASLLFAGVPEYPHRIVVLPISKGSQTAVVAEMVDAAVVETIRQYQDFDVTTLAELNAVLGVERLKDMSGCDDVICTAEITGALGADALIFGNVRLDGDEVVIALTLYDYKKGGVAATAYQRTLAGKPGESSGTCCRAGPSRSACQRLFKNSLRAQRGRSVA